MTFATHHLFGNTPTRIGFGCMGMSEFYGPSDDELSLRVLTTAFDIGYRHFDTSDMYGLGHNELLLGRCIKSLGARRHELRIATKGGIRRTAAAPGTISVDSTPEYLLQACDASLQRLGVEYIDLYYLHRRNKEVPIEESMGAMRELLDAGKIRAVGLSEVSVETLRRAATVVPVSALQSEYSLWTRDPEGATLDVCGELGITFVAYAPIGRGFLAGLQSSQLGGSDLRAKLPRFQPGAFEANSQLVEVVSAIARESQVTAAQVALAWLLASRPYVTAIPGTRSLERCRENFASQGLQLDASQLQRLSAAFVPHAVTGTRYPAALLSTVNT